MTVCLRRNPLNFSSQVFPYPISKYFTTTPFALHLLFIFVHSPFSTTAYSSKKPFKSSSEVPSEEAVGQRIGGCAKQRQHSCKCIRDSGNIFMVPRYRFNKASCTEGSPRNNKQNYDRSYCSKTFKSVTASPCLAPRVIRIRHLSRSYGVHSSSLMSHYGDYSKIAEEYHSRWNHDTECNC